MAKNNYIPTFAAALTVMTSGTLYAQKTPNIIFFLVDDMGWQDTSVPFYEKETDLNKIYHTPNMELLAAKGMKFTQAYACPLSSPTRVSLMTGQNAARHRVTNWTLDKNISADNQDKSDYVEVAPWNVNGMSMEPGITHTVYVTETLPSILRKAGYKTIHVGKAHWGAIGTPGENPLSLGFDVTIAGHAAGGPGSYYGKNNFSAAFRNGGHKWDIPGLEKYHGKDINLTEALTLEAAREMKEATSENRPFYLYLSHYAIHAPWEEDSRFIDKYKQMGLTDFQAVYASMVESMDKSLGDIMQQVKLLGIEDDTIIIFMSDNGQHKDAVLNPPLRGHKITAYEGGIRVPLIIDVPNKTKAGSVCDTPVIVEDMFPTILSMAGSESYITNHETIDGENFSDLLSGGNIKNEKRSFFWHYPHIYDRPPYSVIRKGDWKLIFYYETREVELYNLKEDISEKTNLAKANPKKCKELSKELEEYLSKVNASIPISKTTNQRVSFAN